ncbi:hypothetical protein WJX74_010036 [Apatococcus lobatus]|uniref:AAA+ ATPase domain-containing protein n=1 Tax=Apatococcus lobatus TaxID=904363 RepID=A0AAW1SGB1_9CHLO
MSGPLERVLSRQVLACLESNPTWSVDEVQTHLLRTHREYQRKPQTPLRGAISRALQSHKIQQSSAVVATPGGSQDHSQAAVPHVLPELLPAIGKPLNNHLQTLYGRKPSNAENGEGMSGTALPARSPIPDVRPVKNGKQEAFIRTEGAVSAQEILPCTPAHVGAAGGIAGQDSPMEGALQKSGMPITASVTRQPEKDLYTGPRGKRPRTSDDARAGKASKKARSIGSFVSEPRAIRYADLGGIDAIRQDIQELIENPLRHPEVYAWLGVEPPRGVLLHGPPGCGKTDLAHAIANECSVPFLRISAPEIVAGVSGESEAKVRQLFEEAQRLAPCIIFIDEIDAIAAKRENAQREMERRIVAQMLTCMDDLCQMPAGNSATAGGEHVGDQEDAKQSAAHQARHVVIIGATNRPDALDSALRRAGRFDREISMGIPSEATRATILQVLCKKLRLAGEVNFKTIAARTPGFVGADLRALTKEAAASAIQRIFQQPALQAVADTLPESAASAEPPGEERSGASASQSPFSAAALLNCAICMGDFETAVPKVQPSVRREGFATTPDVTWQDVGALPQVRAALEENICLPISDPDIFRRYQVEAPTGVLLYGPPGCGKTLVAKAVANEAHANFISIKGPELLNKYVGESERAVRQLFARASAAAPCVLFFDEMDALAPRRGADASQSERVVNQLLTEMDGVVGRKGVYMVAATNRPDIIDPALVRPGRLGKMLLVPLPSADGRCAILKTLTRSKPLASNLNLDSIAMDPRCSGFSGADLSALVHAAVLSAIRELRASRSTVLAQQGLSISDILPISMHHFAEALQNVQASVKPDDLVKYLRLPDSNLLAEPLP